MNQILIKHLEQLSLSIEDLTSLKKSEFHWAGKETYLTKWLFSPLLNSINFILLFVSVLLLINNFQPSGSYYFIKAFIATSIISFFTFPRAFNAKVFYYLNYPVIFTLYFMYIEILFFLHNAMEGKGLRESEIKAFHAAQNKAPAIDIPPLRKEYLTNKNEFCRKYFKIKSNSFFQFFDERAFTYDKRLNEGFLYYSLLIPRREELSSDALRRCLQNFPPSGSIDFSTYKVLSPKINEMFKNYTPQQIERLFTNYQGIAGFVELRHHWNKILPLARSFEELFDLLNERELPVKFKALDKSTLAQFNVRVLKTKNDYVLAARDFQNCVLSYFKQKDIFIITLYIEKDPAFCISIKNGVVLEIKGVGNSYSPYESEIHKLLKEEGIV